MSNRTPISGAPTRREEGVGVRERVHEAGLLALRRVHRLESDPHLRELVPRWQRAEAPLENLRGLRLRVVAERACEARDALGSVGRQTADRAASDSMRSAGSPGPSMPGIASWKTDGTSGTHTATRRPCSRRRAVLASSSLGSLYSQSPIASNPAAAYASTSSLEGGADGRDLGEREDHDRPGSFASSRWATGGRVSAFATR